MRLVSKAINLLQNKVSAATLAPVSYSHSKQGFMRTIVLDLG